MTRVAQEHTRRTYRTVTFAMLKRISTRRHTLVTVSKLNRYLNRLNLTRTNQPRRRRNNRQLTTFTRTHTQRPRNVNRNACYFILSRRTLVRPLFRVRRLLTFFRHRLISQSTNRPQSSLHRILYLSFNTTQNTLTLPVLSRLL